MTLLIVLVLAAVLVVIAISLIKKTARNKFKNSSPANTQINSTTVTPSTSNPGSIPDEPGTKGDGGSMLSSGKQG